LEEGDAVGNLSTIGTPKPTVDSGSILFLASRCKLALGLVLLIPICDFINIPAKRKRD
jgi:hypothetical protein